MTHQIADQIQAARPGWVVWWGAWSRRYWAMDGTTTASGCPVLLAGTTPDAITGRIDRVEQRRRTIPLTAPVYATTSVTPGPQVVW